jgi:hypothetical protein
MNSRLARALLVVVSLMPAGLVLALSESSFFLASGSDAATAIYTPSLARKLLALAIYAAGATVGIFATRLATPLRCLLVAVGMVVLALGTHTVVVSFKSGVIQEFWLGALIDRAPFNVAEGVEQDWIAQRRGISWICCTERRRKRSLCSVAFRLGTSTQNRVCRFAVALCVHREACLKAGPGMVLTAIGGMTMRGAAPRPARHDPFVALRPASTVRLPTATPCSAPDGVRRHGRIRRVRIYRPTLSARTPITARSASPRRGYVRRDRSQRTTCARGSAKST